MQGSGSRLQDQRSEENTHQTLTEPAAPLQQRETTSQTGGEQCRAINQRRSRQLIHRLCDHSFRSTGVCDPAGLSGRGWHGGCCPYLSTALQRNTSSPSNASLLAFTKFFNNSRPSTPSRPHCEKVLIEEKKKLQDKLHSGHFGYILSVYADCSSSEQVCFMIDQSIKYLVYKTKRVKKKHPSEVHIASLKKTQTFNYRMFLFCLNSDESIIKIVHLDCSADQLKVSVIYKTSNWL